MSPADPTPPAADVAEPAVALPVDPADAADAAPLAATAVRFCSRCGARFGADQAECASCAARATARAAAAAASTGEPAGVDVAPVRSAVALYFTLLAVSLAMTIYLLASSNDAGGVHAEMVATAAFSAITLAWAVRWRAALWPLLARVGPAWVYLAAPVFAGATFVVASMIVAALRHVLHVPTIGYTEDFAEAGYGFAVAVGMIAVQPAVIEELAFRGVMTSAFDRVLTLREASIVVSLLFGILHLSVPSLLHLTLLGLLLAWLRRRAGSLYPCMLMHFTHNLLVLLDERYRWTPWS